MEHDDDDEDGTSEDGVVDGKAERDEHADGPPTRPTSDPDPDNDLTSSSQTGAVRGRRAPSRASPRKHVSAARTQRDSVQISDLQEQLQQIKEQLALQKRYTGTPSDPSGDVGGTNRNLNRKKKNKSKNVESLLSSAADAGIQLDEQRLKHVIGGVPLMGTVPPTAASSSRDVDVSKRNVSHEKEVKRGKKKRSHRKTRRHGKGSKSHRRRRTTRSDSDASSDTSSKSLSSDATSASSDQYTSDTTSNCSVSSAASAKRSSSSTDDTVSHRRRHRHHRRRRRRGHRSVSRERGVRYAKGNFRATGRIGFKQYIQNIILQNQADGKKIDSRTMHELKIVTLALDSFYKEKVHFTIPGKNTKYNTV